MGKFAALPLYRDSLPRMTALRTTGGTMSTGLVESLQSVTSVACSDTCCGITRPMALANLLLMINSNLVGCSNRNVGRFGTAENPVDLAKSDAPDPRARVTEPNWDPNQLSLATCLPCAGKMTSLPSQYACY